MTEDIDREKNQNASRNGVEETLALLAHAPDRGEWQPEKDCQPGDRAKQEEPRVVNQCPMPRNLAS